LTSTRKGIFTRGNRLYRPGGQKREERPRKGRNKHVKGMRPESFVRSSSGRVTACGSNTEAGEGATVRRRKEATTKKNERVSSNFADVPLNLGETPRSHGRGEGRYAKKK